MKFREYFGKISEFKVSFVGNTLQGHTTSEIRHKFLFTLVGDVTPLVFLVVMPILRLGDFSLGSESMQNGKINQISL